MSSLLQGKLFLLPSRGLGLCGKLHIGNVSYERAGHISKREDTGFFRLTPAEKYLSIPLAYKIRYGICMYSTIH